MEPTQQRNDGSPETEEKEADDEEDDQEGGPSQAEAMVEEATPDGPQITRVERQGLGSEEGVVTYIIPLHYIPSEQMLQMAQAFISSGAPMRKSP